MSAIRRALLVITTVLAISSGYLFLWTHNNDNDNDNDNNNSRNSISSSNRSSAQPQHPSYPLSNNNNNVVFNKNKNPLHKKTSLRAPAKRSSWSKVGHDQAKKDIPPPTATASLPKVPILSEGQDQAKKDTTPPTKTSCRESSSSIKSCCQTYIQNPPAEIDIVIPYMYQEEDDLSLKYELRSFEKNGLLNHVKTVYLLMDTVENADKMKLRYGSYLTRQQQQQQQQLTTAAEDAAGGGGDAGGAIEKSAAVRKSWEDRTPTTTATTRAKNQVQLHIIAMTELRDLVPFPVEKYEANPKLGKSHYAPYLPGIAEYYLLVPDDVVMLREYSRDIWFDASKSLPYGHSFGSWVGGKTHGHPNIAELHGVNFLNRCSLQYVIEKYARGGGGGGGGGGLHNEAPVQITDPDDLSPAGVALGLLDEERLLAKFYSYHSSGFRSVTPHHTEFFRECHTNGGCKSPDGFREIFVNVQGEGVSVEYKEDNMLRNRWSEWFQTSFPMPSRFEGS